MKYSAGDFAHGTPPRISGRETEITTLVSARMLLRGADKVPTLSGYIQSPDSPGIWTPDGGRLYSDISLLETATPECLSGRQTELHNRVGEHRINSLAEQAAKNCHDLACGTILASKRSGYVDVFDQKGELLMEQMSTGQHENYYSPLIAQAMSPIEREHYTTALASYLSTRGTWAGVGIVAGDGFRTTQKYNASLLRGSRSKTTHGSKIPIICREMEGRLEIRTGDGNMSSQVSADVIDVTSLVVRMVEHNAFPEALLVPDLDLTMRDSSIPGRLIITNSGAMTGATHQRLIVEAGLEFASKHEDTPNHEVVAAERVADICQYIDMFDGSTDTLELIVDDVEWAAKLMNIRKHLGNTATISSKNLDAVKRDLQWENLSPEKSIGRRWYASRGDLFTEAEILKAAATPPNTRALARVTILQAEQGITSLDWHRIHADGRGYRLPDPYDTSIHGYSWL